MRRGEAGARAPEGGLTRTTWAVGPCSTIQLRTVVRVACLPIPSLRGVLVLCVLVFSIASGYLQHLACVGYFRIMGVVHGLMDSMHPSCLAVLMRFLLLSQLLIAALSWFGWCRSLQVGLGPRWSAPPALLAASGSLHLLLLSMLAFWLRVSPSCFSRPAFARLLLRPAPSYFCHLFTVGTGG